MSCRKSKALVLENMYIIKHYEVPTSGWTLLFISNTRITFFHTQEKTPLRHFQFLKKLWLYDIQENLVKKYIYLSILYQVINELRLHHKTLYNIVHA